ncbi:MAG: hypothetical protein LBS36_07930 [Oscillospiraceae bacterium]|nr:hypothetical protein [Oscillospiraceae bacterium]
MFDFEISQKNKKFKKQMFAFFKKVCYTNFIIAPPMKACALIGEDFFTEQGGGRSFAWRKARTTTKLYGKIPSMLCKVSLAKQYYSFLCFIPCYAKTSAGAEACRVRFVTV